jgi:hypothetical protein
MYSGNITQKGENMKFFAIATATAVTIVGVHMLIGWVVYNLPIVSILLIMTGFIGFAIALLNDLGVIRIEMSKVLNRASR